MTHSFPASKQFTKLALALAAALIAGTAAQAGTESGTLDVSATVTAACAIGNGTLSFGDVSPALDPNNGQALVSQNKDSQAELSWACTKDTSATIEVGTGMAPETVGPNTVRRMSVDLNTRLRYYLFSDAGRTTSLGSEGVIGSGNTETLVVYGRILGSDVDQAPAGLYQDTVSVTITY